MHCFFHLLPLARPRNVSVHEELDAEVFSSFYVNRGGVGHRKVHISFEGN